jgi:UDP-GlcNAc:undecaprenyl-phosphate GlcNAc-1-phosphate transferase
LTSLAFAIALVASLTLGALVRRLAPTFGAVVPPRPDRWHRAPTPTMGGMAIAAATTIGFLVIAWRPSLVADLLPWAPALAASLAMFVVGVLDDRLQLSPLAKLVASLAIGAFLVFALAGTEPDATPRTAETLLAIVWFAGVCHAFNLLDNMDGLAAGVALIATAFFAWLLADVLGAAMVMLLMSLAGALLGFLYWNRPTARLFMGDSGSLFIGAMLGSTSLVPVFGTGLSLSSPVIPIGLILTVPLFDTAFVLVLRRLAGRSATKGGTDHVSHRLVSLGFSERSAVRILYLLGLITGGVAAALVLTGRVEPELPILAAFLVVMTLVGIYLAPRASLQRRRLPGPAEVLVRAVPEGPGVPVACRRGHARPDSHHGQLLRGLPTAVRRRGLLQVPSVLSWPRCRSCLAARLPRCTRPACISAPGNRSDCAI